MLTRMRAFQARRVDGWCTATTEVDMGDKTDRVSGKVKEAAGKASGDKGLEQKGRDEQAKGDIKSAGKKAKDAIKKQM